MAESKRKEEQVLDVKIREVHENPPDTRDKFGNLYRSLVVEDFHGNLETIEYKESRPERGLEPGQIVICKLCTFDGGSIQFWRAIPLTYHDEDFRNFLPEDYSRMLAAEKRKTRTSASLIVDTDKTAARLQRIAKAKGIKPELLDGALMVAAQYAEFYRQVRDRVFSIFADGIAAYNSQHDVDGEVSEDTVMELGLDGNYKPVKSSEIDEVTGEVKEKSAPIHPMQVEKIAGTVYNQALRRYNL